MPPALSAVRGQESRGAGPRIARFTRKTGIPAREAQGGILAQRGQLRILIIRDTDFTQVNGDFLTPYYCAILRKVLQAKCSINSHRKARLKHFIGIKTQALFANINYRSVDLLRPVTTKRYSSDLRDSFMFSSFWFHSISNQLRWLSPGFSAGLGITSHKLHLSIRYVNHFFKGWISTIMRLVKSAYPNTKEDCLLTGS